MSWTVAIRKGRLWKACGLYCFDQGAETYDEMINTKSSYSCVYVVTGIYTAISCRQVKVRVLGHKSEQDWELNKEIRMGSLLEA